LIQAQAIGAEEAMHLYHSTPRATMTAANHSLFQAELITGMVQQ